VRREKLLKKQVEKNNMLFDCPHCKAKCQFSNLGNQYQCGADHSFQQGWVCSNCNGVIVSKFTPGQNINNSQIFPLVKIKPKIKIDKLPDNIRNDYLESLENYSNGCYTSSVIMCRRVVQQSCIEKGVEKKNLFDQIEELKIDDNLKKLAHKLRFWGNNGAHPDILLGEKIEEKDTKVAVDFTEKFLQYVYVIPKEIEEIEGEVKEKIGEPNKE